ncbi:nucleotidyltransferase domain-containing protein [Candidatus Babeliales bacterium]|nr:nucleotidyltransferase domain-containing protein [Candidatus Babeliales bacterium]
MSVKEQYKKKLTEIIKKYLPSCKIYLFGSRATEKHGKFSDIDIAIDASKQLKTSTLGKIKDDIKESNIPLFVDVLDFNDVSDKMRNQILNYGILWKD